MTLDTNRISSFIAGIEERTGQSCDAGCREFFASYDHAPDPEVALVQLERFVEAHQEVNQLHEALKEERARSVLAAITWNSPYLSGLIINNPHWFYWVAQETALDKTKTLASYMKEAQRIDEKHADTPSRLTALRRFKNRHCLRIGVREIGEFGPIEETARELARVANTCIDAVVRWTRADMVRDYGEPRAESGDPAWFTVLGMGKLGGEELNFSSDVDLLFAYDEDGRTSGGETGQLSNLEFFNRQATHLVNGLEATSPEGFLYRVDMRLRPDGQAGMLVAPISAYEFYYETRGGAWERQALLRARCVGGNTKTGERFLNTVRPFTYRKYIDPLSVKETLRGILDLRKKMIDRYATEEEAFRDVKNGPGGLRDVEFTIQATQILYGGQYPEIRVTNSLDALQRIYESGLLRTSDYNIFREAYLFLRRVEHRLQMTDQLQTFRLPETPESQNRLARSLGYPGRDDFIEAYTGHTRAVRKMYNAIFVEEELANPVEMVFEANNEKSIEYLKNQGFRDPKQARRLFQSLGESPSAPHLAGKMRRLLRDYLPWLMENLSHAANPDMGLLNFTKIVESCGSPTGLYQTLIDAPQFIELLVKLCSGSRFLSDVVIQDPSVLDALVDPEFLTGDVDETKLLAHLDHLSYAGGARPFSEGMMRLRNIETLRCGLRFLLGLTDIRRATELNAFVADFIVERVFEDQCVPLIERYGAPMLTDGSPCGFAIIGLGKLGGRELNFGSDLDLLFVHVGDGETRGGESKSISNAEFWTKVASGILTTLSGRSKSTALYEADARLRPYGKSAPLSTSLAAADRYYNKDAQTWERLALTRARFIAGDRATGDSLLGITDRTMVAPPAGKEVFEEIRYMRKRIEAARKDETLKAGPGGIVDVEFLVQSLMLGRDPAQRRTNTWEALDMLEQQGVIPSDSADTLREAFTFLREIETRLRLVDNVSVDRLPSSKEELQTLVARMYSGDKKTCVTVDAFLSTLEEHTRNIREIFKQFI